MPKIVINEYDLTKAGTGEYANFSVVVPGLLGPNADLADLQSKFIFDENGIYECSSQSDFVKYVGKTTGTVLVDCLQNDAVAPTITTKLMLAEKFVEKTEELKSDAPVHEAFVDEVTGVNTVCFYSKEAFMNCIANAYMGYKPVVNENTTGEGEDQKTTFEHAQDTTGDGAPDYGIYTAKQNGTSTVAELMDAGYIYTETRYDEVLKFTYNKELGEGDTAPEIKVVGDLLVLGAELADFDVKLCVSPATAFYIIADNAKGSAATIKAETVKHDGNQIAYELLGLGYTVLYKAIYDGSPALSNAEFWNALKDKSTYDFRYVVTGLASKNSAANAAIISLCEWNNTTLDDANVLDDGRGDCFALVDIDSSVYANKAQSEAIPYISREANKFASAYAACFAPTVTYTMVEDAEYNNNTTFPASFHYLACAANSANNNYNEWYANAGYTRGVAKYTIQSLGCKLGDMAVQTLQPRFLTTAGPVKYTVKVGGEDTEKTSNITTNVSVNLVIKIKNSYYLWGNRTAKKLGTRGASDGDLVAQHFLNIRQLCTTIKKQVYVTCRRLTYDPNSNNLWINFRALLTPMLEQMKADQGIRDYEFVKDATDRKALLKASIRIVPIEAVEDFEIGLYLEDSLTEASVTEA